MTTQNPNPDPTAARAYGAGCYDGGSDVGGQRFHVADCQARTDAECRRLANLRPDGSHVAMPGWEADAELAVERQIREAALEASSPVLRRVARGDTADAPRADLRQRVAAEELARRARHVGACWTEHPGESHLVYVGADEPPAWQDDPEARALAALEGDGDPGPEPDDDGRWRFAVGPDGRDWMTCERCGYTTPDDGQGRITDVAHDDLCDQPADPPGAVAVMGHLPGFEPMPRADLDPTAAAAVAGRPDPAWHGPTADLAREVSSDDDRADDDDQEAYGLRAALARRRDRRQAGAVRRARWLDRQAKDLSGWLTPDAGWDG